MSSRSRAPRVLRFARCAYCGRMIAGKPTYTIHRDFGCEGPEVALCNRCADTRGPCVTEIWERTSRIDAPADTR